MTSSDQVPWARRFASKSHQPPVGPTPRRPSLGRVIGSIFVVASVLCLLASVVLTGWLAIAGGDDTRTPIGFILLSFGVFLFHGPLLVVEGWPIGVPVIVALGVVLAYFRRRPGSASGRFATVRRVGLIVLVGYGILLAAAWTVLLLGAI
jgi:hypothetical protein